MPSSPSPSAPLNPAALRSTLKTWERHFKAIQGRVPTKADIKANPDIAKMYSAYNLSRTGARPKPSSLPAGVPSPGKGDPTQTTPKTQKRVQKLALPDQGPSKTSMTYSKADSPSKLRKLAQENSPRKVDPSRSARAQRRLMNSRANPFNSSYGGQGSPGLFADALPPPNTTPRTRARNFLIGVGSPIKAKANGRTPHGRTPSTGLLSSFLNPQRTSPAKHFQAGAARGDEGGGDGEDEVLGPSPFKPKANSSFKSLFDLPDHQADLEATPLRKQSNLKWKISSQPPFNSQAQRAFVDAPAKDNPTNFQGTKVAKDLRRASSLGSKRKRAVTAEEDERFDKDIKVEPDIAPAQNRVAHSDASKKKRVAHSKKQVPAAKPALAASRRSPSNCSESHESYQGSESGALKLPFGHPRQPGVYTELETFAFTNSPSAEETFRNSHSPPSPTVESGGLRKGKGRAVRDHCTEDDPLGIKVMKPIQKGTERVLIRPYRPRQAPESDKIPSLALFGKAFSQSDSELATQWNGEQEQDEESETDRSEKTEQINGPGPSATPEETKLPEGDIHLSEELMHILSIQDGPFGQARLKAREEKVRNILDGGKSLLQRTFSAPPAQPQKHQKGSTPRVGMSKVMKSKAATSPTQDDLAYDLQLELALQEKESEEEAEAFEEEDGDWEEEPDGWKAVTDGFDLEDGDEL